MPRHTLPAGRSAIDALEQLGKALGYVVVRELPIERRRANPPAVDVAWFGDAGQDYPLMIFEVESVTSNAAANNALKVLGSPNEKFEKPLFFFHIFLKGGAKSTRVATLRSAFGTHNYRAYKFTRSEKRRLIDDVLVQHRRLRNRLESAPLIKALGAAVWEKDVSVSDVLDAVAALKFDGSFLHEYAKAQLDDQFIKFLLSKIDEVPAQVLSGQYKTYVGQSWSVPIHFGLLALRAPDKGAWLERLRQWQESSSYMTMIGPHFGLSMDYDDFILGQAPVLLGLTAALMHKVDGAAEYIFKIFSGLLKRMDRMRFEFSAYTALWMLHIAAASDDRKHYEMAASFINERGGVSKDSLLVPPSGISPFDTDKERVAQFLADRQPVPDFTTFSSMPWPRQNSNVDGALASLCLHLLSDDNAVVHWDRAVLPLLHDAYAIKKFRS
jgi:hypothetical protein